MTKTFCLFVLFSFSSLLAGAQKYADGYVVTLEGDTLHGKLEVFNKYRSCRAVKFIKDDSLSFTYSPLSLKSYYRDKETYESKIVRGVPSAVGNRVFMKKMIDGKVSMYYYCYTNNSASLKGTDPWSSVPQHLPASLEGNTAVFIAKTDDQEPLEVKKRDFNSAVSRYLSDSPEVLKKTGSGEVEYKDLPQIVKIYNGQ